MTEEIKDIPTIIEERESKNAGASESYWQIVRKQFKKNKLAVWSLRIIMLFALIALLSDFIANERPLMCTYQGNTYFPVFKGIAVDWGLSEWQDEFKNITWKDLEFESVIWPPVPYLPQNLDVLNSNSVSPMDDQEVESTRWKHWLGTDEIGRDVLSGMIHGTKTALLVGLISMGIAALIGILMGSLAGYFGDDKLKMTVASIILNVLALFFGIFYGFGNRSYTLGEAMAEGMGSVVVELLISFAIIIGLLLLANLFAKVLSNVPFLSKKVTIPLDIIISRLIEIMVSVPTLFLIISISATVEKPSVAIVMVIIGLTSWTGIARFMRAELLRIRRLEYVEAAKALGYNELRTIVKHAIPNALSPVLIAIAFGIAAAILIEATLSFIGIGMPAEEITWGSMLAMSRQTPSAWWLAIFPGLAIFITVTVYNLVGEGLTDAIDPKQKK